MDWKTDHDLTLGPIKIHIPSGALYNTDEFNLFKKGEDTYVIGEAIVPLQKHMTLNWRLDSIKQREQGWFAWEYDNKGKKSALTGERQEDFLKLQTRSTGSYQLDQDLKKPEIRLVKNVPLLRINSGFKEIHVHAADNKTGIDRYSARIDGEFARIDFDYKKELLKVIIPKEIGRASCRERV